MIVVVDDMITIGDFSIRCGLSPRSLLTYSEAGVFVPALVDPARDTRRAGRLMRACESVDCQGAPPAGW